MGRTGTAWAVPRIGASGDLRVLTSLACPRARALNSNEDAPAVLALSDQQFGRLVGRDGKSQLAAVATMDIYSMTSRKPACRIPGRVGERSWMRWGKAPEAWGPRITPSQHASRHRGRGSSRGPPSEHR